MLGAMSDAGGTEGIDAPRPEPELLTPITSSQPGAVRALPWIVLVLVLALIPFTALAWLAPIDHGVVVVDRAGAPGHLIVHVPGDVGRWDMPWTGRAEPGD